MPYARPFLQSWCSSLSQFCVTPWYVSPTGPMHAPHTLLYGRLCIVSPRVFFVALTSPHLQTRPQCKNYPNLMAFPPWFETCILLLAMYLLFANEASQVCLLALQQAAVPPSYASCASCVLLVFPAHRGSQRGSGGSGNGGGGGSALLNNDQDHDRDRASNTANAADAADAATGTAPINKLPALFIGQTLQVVPYPSYSPLYRIRANHSYS